jgi:hypothetical protein
MNRDVAYIELMLDSINKVEDFLLDFKTYN